MRVGVARQRRVRRVVAVGAEGVGRDVALGEEDVRGGLPAEVAGVLVGVGRDVAGRERREEGVDAGVAGQEVWRRGGALPDRAELVDAV